MNRKKFFALLKVSIRSMLLSSTNGQKNSRKKAATGMGAILLIGFLGLYMSGMYSAMLVQILSPMQMEILIFIFMGIGALIGGLMFTTFAVKGVVFGGRDNDLLLSMPVSSTALMASRISAIYLENLLFSFFVMVPAGVVCALMSSNGVGRGLLFWARLLIVVLTLPLLDTALSVLLGALTAFLSVKVSKGALGQNLVMGLFLAAVFYFSFRLNSMIEKLASNAAGVKESLSWAAPIMWMGEGIMGNWLMLLAFVLCCVIPFGAMIFGLGRVYRQAVTAFQNRSARHDYRLSAQTASGQKKALLMKEARKFFGTPMYFWNAGLGLIMLLAAGIASLVMRKNLLVLAESLGTEALMPAAALVIGFCLCVCPISAPSVSLEGRFLWVLREAPIREEQLLWVKTGFHLMLTLPCTIIAGVCIAAALSFPLWQTAVLLAAMLIFAVWQAVFGMLMGLCFPKLDAVNETAVVKQSMAVMLGTFVPMAVLGAAGVLYWLGNKASKGIELLLPILFLAGLMAICIWILVRKGAKMLRTL